MNYKSLVSILVVASCIFTIETVAQSVIRGPYLQMPTHNSIIVRWRTDVATSSKVTYGNATIHQTNSVVDNTAKTEHIVKITGLEPYTQYFYTVGTANQILSGPDGNHHFTTNPVPGTEQPIRVWAIGDFGKGNAGQTAVKNSYINYTRGRKTDVWLWLGDNAYNSGTDSEYQSRVFTPFQDVFKYIPFWPAPGNHDYTSVCAIPCFQNPESHSGPYYDIISVPQAGEAGGVPSDLENYYSFDYGNAHFISLNSELGSPLISSWDYIGAYSGTITSSVMIDWLKADLAANTKPWVIVYFHQPPYTKGSHDSDNSFELYMAAMRRNFTNIFDQYGVDMVICGHSHVFERSYLIKNHRGNTGSWNPATMLVDGSSGKYSEGNQYYKPQNGPGGEGTIYVVCGNSGSSEDNPPSQPHPAMYYRDFGGSAFGSFVIDIKGNRLDAKYLKSDGTIADKFTMMKGDTILFEPLKPASPRRNSNIGLFNIQNQAIYIKYPFVPGSHKAENEQGEISFRQAGIPPLSANLRLMNILGQEVFSARVLLIDGANQIDVPEKLLPGLYILSIESAEETITGKVIAQDK